MSRQEMKALAKEQIKGNIGVLFLITLIIGAISFVAGFVCSAIPVIGPLIPSVVITPAFALSVVRVYLNLAKGVEPSAGNAFDGFDDFWTAFKVSFLVGLYTFLWSLLFVIPGIIKGYSYSQAMYVAAENPGISATEAIERSKAMMEGHKMELFILMLSFIGWSLLADLTCGILYIWLIPYMSATMVNFYNAVKPEEPTYTDEPKGYSLEDGLYFAEDTSAQTEYASYEAESPTAEAE